MPACATVADGEEAQCKEEDHEARETERKGEGRAVIYLDEIETITRAAIQ